MATTQQLWKKYGVGENHPPCGTQLLNWNGMQFCPKCQTQCTALLLVMEGDLDESS